MRYPSKIIKEELLILNKKMQIFIKESDLDILSIREYIFK